MSYSSCVNSEVLKEVSKEKFTATLTQEWLKWNDKGNCVFVVRDSRKNESVRFVLLGEAEKYLDHLVS
jgi:hypothetical protein